MGAAGEIPWPHQNPVTAPHRPCRLYWGQHLAASSPPRQYGTQGLFWRPSCSKCLLPGSTWESGIVSSACPGDGVLFSACTRMTCALGAATCSVHRHSCSPGRTPWFPPPAGVLVSSGRALLSAATPVPRALSQRAGEVWQQRPRYFFSLSLTLFPTFPGDPEPPHAVFLCRLFFIWVSGERKNRRGA